MKININGMTIVLDKSKLLSVEYIHKMASKIECQKTQNKFYHEILSKY